MNRRLIYVMGPSGAGKDSVLDWLRANLPPEMQVHWAQRTITRPASAGGEAHEATDVQGFEQLHHQGAFALAWQANGLHYGIRHTELARLQQGHWVLDEFRFHMSLTGPLNKLPPEAQDAVQAAATAYFEGLPTCRFGHLALFVEPQAGADFEFVDTMALSA